MKKVVVVFLFGLLTSTPLLQASVDSRILEKRKIKKEENIKPIQTKTHVKIVGYLALGLAATAYGMTHLGAATTNFLLYRFVKYTETQKTQGNILKPILLTQGTMSALISGAALIIGWRSFKNAYGAFNKS